MSKVKPVSEEKLAANRANARKSTGPRSASGKSKVAQNASKHGFASRSACITPAEQPEFDKFKTELLRETQPLGPLELEHFNHFLNAAWTLRRLDYYESGLLAPKPGQPHYNPFIDPACLPSLATLNRYRADLKREILRSSREIERLQTKRAALNLAHPATAISIAGPAPCADPLKLTKQTQTANDSFEANNRNNQKDNVFDCPSISQRLTPILQKMNTSNLSTNQTHAIVDLARLTLTARDSKPPDPILVGFSSHAPEVEPNPSVMKK